MSFKVTGLVYESGPKLGGWRSFAVDPQISPGDAVAMVECVLPGVQERLQAQRLEAKARAQVKGMGEGF